MPEHGNHPVVMVEYPDWVDSVVDWNRTYTGDEERMRLAIAVSRANVEKLATDLRAQLIPATLQRRIVGIDVADGQGSCIRAARVAGEGPGRLERAVGIAQHDRRSVCSWAC